VNEMHQAGVRPIPARAESVDVQRVWANVLWWWACLVTLMLVSVPLILIACGMGWLSVGESTLIAYIVAVTGGTSILAVVGGLVLKPFATVR
jgi:hypothetical protein